MRNTLFWLISYIYIIIYIIYYDKINIICNLQLATHLQQLASAVQWELSTCLRSVVANWCPIGPQIHQWHLSTKIQQETPQQIQGIDMGEIGRMRKNKTAFERRKSEMTSFVQLCASTHLPIGQELFTTNCLQRGQKKYWDPCCRGWAWHRW